MTLINLNWESVVIETEEGNDWELLPGREEEINGSDYWYVVVREMVPVVEQLCGEIPILCPGGLSFEWRPGQEGPIRCEFLYPGNAVALKKNPPKGMGGC